MSTLIIRNVDPATVKKLNILAAVAGLSREEFIRQLLDREGARFALDAISEAVKGDTTIRRPTDEEIARSFDLWGEYVDPDATMTRVEFDSMTVEQRINHIHETFAPSEWNTEGI